MDSSRGNSQSIPGNGEEWAAESLQVEALLLARTYLYELYHKVAGGQPSAELLALLVSSQTRDVVDEYANDDATMAGLKAFLQGLGQEDPEQLLDQAKDEYTRLFIGPGELVAQPYRSPFITRERTLFQEETIRVRRLYKRYGFVPKAYLRMPDDHVALFCHFMALLSESLLEDYRSEMKDAVEIAASMREQSAIVAEYLMPWLPDYAKQMRYSKTAVLYPQLFEALASFVSDDKTFLDEAAYWLEQQAAQEQDARGLESQTADESSPNMRNPLPEIVDKPESFVAVESALAELHSLELFGHNDTDLVECID